MYLLRTIGTVGTINYMGRYPIKESFYYLWICYSHFLLIKLKNKLNTLLKQFHIALIIKNLLVSSTQFFTILPTSLRWSLKYQILLTTKWPKGLFWTAWHYSAGFSSTLFIAICQINLWYLVNAVPKLQFLTFY